MKVNADRDYISGSGNLRLTTKTDDNSKTRAVRSGNILISSFANESFQPKR